MPAAAHWTLPSEWPPELHAAAQKIAAARLTALSRAAQRVADRRSRLPAPPAGSLEDRLGRRLATLDGRLVTRLTDASLQGVAIPVRPARAPSAGTRPWRP